MESVEDKLNKTQALDYLSQIVPNVNLDNIAESQANDSTKAGVRMALAVPPVDGNNGGGQQPASAIPTHTPSPTINNVQQPAPQTIKPMPAGAGSVANPPQQKDNSKEFDAKINEIYKILDGFVSLNDLNIFKNVLMEAFSEKLAELNDKFIEFQRHLVPDRKVYDNEVVYKSNVASVAVKVVDNDLLPILTEIASSPDYSILSVSTTKYFEDGTVCNSLVDIDIKIYYKNVACNFSAQIPILNGVVYSPMYLQHYGKLIPIIKEDLLDALNKAAGVFNTTFEPESFPSNTIFNMPLPQNSIPKSKYPVITTTQNVGVPESKIPDIQLMNTKNTRYSE